MVFLSSLQVALVALQSNTGSIDCRLIEPESAESMALGILRACVKEDFSQDLIAWSADQFIVHSNCSRIRCII